RQAGALGGGEMFDRIVHEASFQTIVTAMSRPLSPAPPRLPEELQEKSLDDLDLEAGSSWSGMELIGGGLRSDRAEDLAFDEVVLRSVQFDGARFPNLSLLDCELRRCDLANAILPRCSLIRTVFRDCRLTGTQFPEALIKDVTFSECRLDLSTF